MKKIISLLLALTLVCGVVFAFTACGGDEKKPEKQEAEFDYSKATAEDLLAEIKDTKNVTEEEYLWLVSTLENVAITDELELEENITFEALDLLDENDAEFPGTNVLINGLIEHEAPQVRGYVMGYMGGLFGTSDDDIAAVFKVLETETEPYVLKCAVEAVQNEGNANADVASFLLKMAEHEHPRVRYRAALALGNSWSDEVEGAAEAIIKLMNDEDILVREMACRYSGKLHNEAVIAPLTEILNNPDEVALHDECLEGLLLLWLDYPFHEHSSEAAYRATLDYYNNTEITEETPPWTAISSLKSIASDGIEEWKAIAPFYNPAEIVAAMTRIIESPEAEWLGRSAAINVIDSHGTKADLEAIGPMIEGLSDENASFIQDEYAEVLAAAE